ncbi:CopG family ribbon-helix-helix protein [Haloarcula salina]|uniref:Transcription factor NikR nickel binding C-terminal domain-containing protein n=1 Tax=Haloarcula salina TaxID=1429914 RepID=A0AA41KG27_9EURY|nr:hypothetical protein [Haloarcula salina]MBV0902637.1 hypothetical protein [Haloarcula salina]
MLEEYQETDYEDRRVLATITAVFGYDEPVIERRMMDIRHEFEASIRSNSHDCLEGNADCVETFVIEVAYDDARRFIATARGADEPLSVKYRSYPSISCAHRSASDKFETTCADGSRLSCCQPLLIYYANIII